MANEITNNIPCRIKNIAVNGHVTGAKDIFDDVIEENQEVINSRVNQDIKSIKNSKGVAGGLATLGTDGKVPVSQLPSYVDSVVDGYYYNDSFYEDASHTILITPGTNTIYNDIPTNVSYRYSGSHYVPVSNALTPDEEDLTAENSTVKFKNKSYDASNFSGLGRVYLRKNISGNKNVLTQSMINSTNTEYIIQYDYDLLGEIILIPLGSVLHFKGGSFNNGTLVGVGTQILTENNKGIFNWIHISGSWNVPEITSAWFTDATDDNVIKQCFNLAHDYVHNTITIENGFYNVDTLEDYTGAITVGSNTEVIILGTIQQKANSFDHAYVIDVAAGAENVYIHGNGTIIGNKATHPTPSGKSEWGHGINICESYNVTVEGITIKDCWGDSIYVGYQATPAVSVVLRNLTLDGSRRQGISITSAKNILVDNCVIKNISGTSPQSGIDIEPNANSIIDNVAIKNCNITNCGGWGIDLYNVNINSMNDILIQNVVVDGCKYGIGGTYSYNITNLMIDSVIIKNHADYGLYLYTRNNPPSSSHADYWTSPYNVNISNVYVDNQGPSPEHANVQLWINNGKIESSTFKNSVTIGSYNYNAADGTGQLEHGLAISGCVIMAGSKNVTFHNGSTISNTAVTCGYLRLPNGHAQFNGCTIRCSNIVADNDPLSATSYNTFTGCNVICSNNIYLAHNSGIRESIVNANSIRMSDYSSITNSDISATLYLNTSCVNVSNNKITVGISKIGTGNGSYAVKLPGTNCRLCNNDITIQDDNQGISGINGPISVHGAGCVVKGNKITVSGSRSYSSYGIYMSSTEPSISVEDNAFIISVPFTINCFNSDAASIVPYADISKPKTGTTAERPSLLPCNRTFQYFDTTLGKPIYAKTISGGVVTWVDATGATV